MILYGPREIEIKVRRSSKGRAHIRYLELPHKGATPEIVRQTMLLMKSIEGEHPDLKLIREGKRIGWRWEGPAWMAALVLAAEVELMNNGVSYL